MAFLGAGVFFAVVPDRVVEVLNAAGRLARWPGPELAPASSHLWHVLAISLMGTLVAMSSRAIKDLGRSLFLVRLIILSKVISGLGYIVVFSTGERCFAYLAGAIVDLGIAGITSYYYRHVVALRGSL